MFWYSACVARPVDRKERAINAKAMAVLDKEWNKLITQKCWDYASVREWKDVAAEADRQGFIKAHVGRIFDICVHTFYCYDYLSPQPFVSSSSQHLPS